MAEREPVEITHEQTIRKTQFRPQDWKEFASYICDELSRRKSSERRKSLCRQWMDIDRQLAMQRMPRQIAWDNQTSNFLVDQHGRNIDRGTEKLWMPEVEEALQSQTLETLMADNYQFRFPRNGAWFRAVAHLSESYQNRLDRGEGMMDTLIANNQQNANRLVEAWMRHTHDQYPFKEHWDYLDAEAIKYGTFVGRIRTVNKTVYIDTEQGMMPETQRFTVLFPRTIKNTYLDDRKFSLLNDGLVLGPAQIYCEWKSWDDLVIAANKGSRDPNDENGGWMPKGLKGIDRPSDGQIEVIEYEGDMIVPRKSGGSIVLPGAITTVIQGGSDGAAVIRHRWRKSRHSTYLVHCYQVQDVDCPYGVGPLMKERPIQNVASESLNRYLQAAILNTEPPVGYRRDEAVFRASGGPVIQPRAQWATDAPVEIHQIGDPAALFNGYVTLRAIAQEVTGVNAPRLGDRVVSHTTATANAQALQRTVSRSVAYGDKVIDNPLTRFMYIQFEQDRAAMSGERTFYVPEFEQFITITKEQLPDQVWFEIFGASGPAEEQARQQSRITAIQAAIQLEMLRKQAGLPGPDLDINRIQRNFLGEGGYAESDIDGFFTSQSAGLPAQPPGVPGISPGTAPPGGPAAPLMAAE